MPLLTIDEQHALAGQDEEVLLFRCRVVERVRLAWPDHVQHQAQLREHDRRELRMAVNDPGTRLERASRAELLVRHPRRIGNVDDEPAVASRHETRVDRLETRLLHHANRYAPGLMLSICA